MSLSAQAGRDKFQHLRENRIMVGRGLNLLVVAGFFDTSIIKGQGGSRQHSLSSLLTISANIYFNAPMPIKLINLSNILFFYHFKSIKLEYKFCRFILNIQNQEGVKS